MAGSSRISVLLPAVHWCVRVPWPTVCGVSGVQVVRTGGGTCGVWGGVHVVGILEHVGACRCQSMGAYRCQSMGHSVCPLLGHSEIPLLGHSEIPILGHSVYPILGHSVYPLLGHTETLQ